MAKKPRLQRLTVHLLKEDTSVENALRDLAAVNEYEAASGEASLFIAPTIAKPPSWLRYLEPYFEADALRGITNASTAAVLLLEVEARLFALTFGYGRNLLAPERIVQDFGLRVVLNTVAPDQLKSVDARTFEELTLHTRRDVSRQASLQAFGLDLTRDLVRAVTGTPLDETLAHRFTGADALAISTREQLSGIPALCARLIGEYRSDAYRKHFEFIDHLRRVRDISRTGELDGRLIEALNERQLDDLHLAPPEVMDHVDTEGYRFSTDRRAEVETDPRISHYLRTREDAVTIETLKRDRVEAISATTEGVVRNWRVYDCIVFEATIASSLFVLTAGQWFEVDRTFQERVVADVAAIPSPSVAMPNAADGMSEPDYNVQAAKELGALNLDSQLVRRSVPDPIEVRDLLTREKALIYVKKRGSSATLSHLWAQARTTGALLLSDPAFRAEARGVAGNLDAAFADVLPAASPRPGDYEMAFVVITRGTRKQTPLTLPFFSLVSLRSAANDLRAFGYRVTAAAVTEGTQAA